MYMDVGMDTGDIILKAQIPIGVNETSGEVHDRLKVLGAEILSETLTLVAVNKAPHTAQDNDIATYASLLNREHEKINWHKPAIAVNNLVRGLNPWPGAYCLHNSAILKIWSTQVESTVDEEVLPGRVEAVTNDAIIVQTSKGKVALLEVQPANKRRMTGGEYARGYGLKPGDVII